MTSSSIHVARPEQGPSSTAVPSHGYPGLFARCAPGPKRIVHKIDVIYVNVNTASDFRMLRTGTNEHIYHVLTQLTKHVARGLYNTVRFNATEHSCVVVFSTEKSKDDLSYKNGFPWDPEDAPQPKVVL